MSQFAPILRVLSEDLSLGVVMAHARNRYLVASLSLIGSTLVVGCGGESPPTGGGRSATTIAVSAGNGQTVAAGQSAAVAPAVIVRDAQGAPFGGASVQFAVTSGGGSLEGASQVTDAAGIARVTRWTVGASGPQRVTATVGSLTPVLFEATVGVAGGTTTTTIPASGGVVSISTVGHPYQGLSLTIPQGTFPSGVTWSMRVRTDLTVPTLPAGYQVGGPILEITTDAPRGGALMTLNIPMGPPTGMGMVLAYYDPIRRVMEVLPTVAQSATSTRVVTKHLRADLLLGKSLPALFAPFWSQHGGTSSIGALIPITFSLPQPAVPNVTTDQWPVLDYGSAEFPDGFGAAIPALRVAAAVNGTSTSSTVKPLSTPGFYADAGILEAVQSAAASPGIDPQGLAALVAQSSGLPKSQRDDLAFQNTAASLALAKGPTLVAMFPVISGPTATGTVFANPIATTSNGITMATPADGTAGVLGKLPSGFQATAAKIAGDLPPASVDAAVPLPSFVFDYTEAMSAADIIDGYDGLNTEQKIAVNEQIIEILKQKNDLLLKVICNIRDGGSSLRAVGGRGGVGGGTARCPAGTSEAVRGDSLRIVASDSSVKLGVYDYESGQELATDNGSGVEVGGLPGPTGSAPRRLVVVTVRRDRVKQGTPLNLSLERAPFRATPDTARVTADSTTVRFDAEVLSPPTGGFRVNWDWGDGTSSQNSNSTTATHNYTVAGDYTVTVELLSIDGAVVLAQYTVAVRSEASPHWRLTFLNPANAPDTEELGPLGLILDRALAAPASAMISIIAGSGTGFELRLRVLANGTWTAANCCAANGAPVPGETSQQLGVSPSIVYPVGSWFAGYGESRFSQSTADLASGTMSGQYVLGTYTYFVRDQGYQLGPTATLRFEGTRSGTSLTGSITVVVWEVGNSSPPQVTPAELYSMPFTAVRIK